MWDLQAASGAYDAQSAKKLASYIKPHLNVLIDCGTSVNNKCMDSTMYRQLKGSNQVAYGASTVYYKMILADGSLVWFRTNGNECSGEGDGVAGDCAKVWFDINGKRKPNQLGRDTFYLKIVSNGILYPDSDYCSLSSTGFGCLSYIMLHNNMDYLNGA